MLDSEGNDCSVARSCSGTLSNKVEEGSLGEVGDCEENGQSPGKRWEGKGVRTYELHPYPSRRGRLVAD
jgi:hypothetical protein